MPDPLLSTLQQATAGLLYPSEYDAPLEPFVWEPADNTPTEVHRLSGHSPQDRCQPLSGDAFFGELAEVEGCAALYETLKAILTDRRVYQFGEANLTVYAVGRDAHRRLAGFTHARSKRHPPRMEHAHTGEAWTSRAGWRRPSPLRRRAPCDNTR